MAMISKYIKEKTDPNAKIVFIGPCTAKKMEFQLESVKPYVDSCITFEELQALFDSRDIDIMTLHDTDFELKAISCDGIEECRMALLKKNKGVLDKNFIEGMACMGGCIGGAGCLTHGERNKTDVDKYGMEAYEKTITDAISVLK